MSMYQHPDVKRSIDSFVSTGGLELTGSKNLMNLRRPLDLRDGSPDLDGLYLVEESKKHSIKILGDEVLPNGFTAKGKPCLFENGKPVYVAKNTKNMLSALAAMEKV